MLLDQENLFSNDQDFFHTATTSTTTYSTNVIDLGAADSGNAADIRLLCQVTEAAASASSLTMDFQLQTAADTAFTTPTTVCSTGALAKTALVVGYDVPLFPILPESLNRYLRIAFVQAGEVGTAGQVMAGLVADIQTNKNG